jgi:hypothetical protein
VSRALDPNLHALWRERIGRQVQSDLKIAPFCALDRFSAASFHAWKRRLRLIEPAKLTRVGCPTSLSPRHGARRRPHFRRTNAERGRPA